MRILTTILFSIVFAISVSAQVTLVESIEIESRWGGLGTPSRTRVLIVRKGVEFASAGKRIDAEKIENLLRSLREPIVTKPTLENLGITTAWLNDKVIRCVEDCANGYIGRSNWDQKRLFISKFTDLSFVELQLADLFRGGWTDDYPSFEARIKFSSGAETKVASDSQTPYMIPWEVSDTSGTKVTFNTHISKALLSLIPPKATNAQRLGALGIVEDLASITLRTLESEWKRLEVMSRLRNDIASFEKDYEIVSMEMNSNHDSDFGTPWDKPPIEKNLHIVLRKPGFPKGFALKVILPVENDRVQNIELFQRSIDSYINLINSVKWLKNFVDTTGQSVWLRFVKNRSFSEKGMITFAKDMTALGKANLATEVEEIKDRVALVSLGDGLEYYQSFWLILPDGRSIVWRNYNVAPPGLTLTGKECAQNRSNTQPCVGALLSDEGKLLKP